MTHKVNKRCDGQYMYNNGKRKKDKTTNNGSEKKNYTENYRLRNTKTGG